MNSYKEVIYDLRHYFYDTEVVLEAADAIEQLVKERDAAVDDLKSAMPCKACKHLTDLGYCERCYLERHWEWRGVKEGDDE